MGQDFIQSPCSSNYTTSRRESFTLWMKSLLFHGKGCTVFDSNGAIVYRVDNNDDNRCSSEVDLMDIHGKLLFSIRRKRKLFSRRCDGYKSIYCTAEELLCFKVRKDCSVLCGYRSYHVTLWPDGTEESSMKIIELRGKSGFKIINGESRLVAEVSQKQSSSGVTFGEDVLSLIVEPDIDHSLVVALVTAYSLVHHKL